LTRVRDVIADKGVAVAHVASAHRVARGDAEPVAGDRIVVGVAGEVDAVELAVLAGDI
jgi:hypothetical protein